MVSSWGVQLTEKDYHIRADDAKPDWQKRVGRGGMEVDPALFLLKESGRG
jgi:hypothetical protein